jgi:hypothetical protein
MKRIQRQLESYFFLLRRSRAKTDVGSPSTVPQWSVQKDECGNDYWNIMIPSFVAVYWQEVRRSLWAPAFTARNSAACKEGTLGSRFLIGPRPLHCKFCGPLISSKCRCVTTILVVSFWPRIHLLDYLIMDRALAFRKLAVFCSLAPVAPMSLHASAM